MDRQVWVLTRPELPGALLSHNIRSLVSDQNAFWRRADFDAQMLELFPVYGALLRHVAGLGERPRIRE
jgi:hypothetical protein